MKQLFNDERNTFILISFRCSLLTTACRFVISNRTQTLAFAILILAFVDCR